LDKIDKSDIWKIYETVNEWIRFSDSKAGAVLAANGVIIGLLAPSAIKFKQLILSDTFLTNISIACLTSLLVSVVLSLVSLTPTLKIIQPKTHIYFGHIAESFPDASSYQKELSDNPKVTTSLSAQIAGQIWANSKIALWKYRLTKWAILSLGLAIISSIASVAYLFI
jgi:hypothetical protein